MRARALLSADVVESDWFLQLSLEAQVAYVHTVFASDVTGRIVGAARVVRGLGFDADVLAELYGAGLLIDIGGRTFDRFCWVNSKYDGRMFSRMDGVPEFRSGALAFEGEQGRSPYRIPAEMQERHTGDVEATHERRMSDVEATHERRPTQRNGNGSTAATAMATQPNAQAAATASSLDALNAVSGAEARPCMCRRCGSPEASYATVAGATVISCPECGSYEFE